MDTTKVTGLLKKAIILEKQGQTFYRSISDTTKINSLKDFFNTMADEESFHEKELLNQLDFFTNKGEFTTNFQQSNSEEFAEYVLSSEIINSIKGADYEASAISAAMALEVRSSEFYSKHAMASEDQKEKDFFTYLSTWESSHLKTLSDLNRKLLENALKEDIY